MLLKIYRIGFARFKRIKLNPNNNKCHGCKMFVYGSCKFSRSGMVGYIKVANIEATYLLNYTYHYDIQAIQNL